MKRALIAAGGLVLWFLVASPAFVHPELYGPELVTDILQFPRPPHHPYGFVYYALLKLMSLVSGGSAEGVMRANAVLCAACAIPLGALAQDWSGRRSAGIFTALLWVSSALVARVGWSEDANVSAALLAATALLAFERAATRRSWAWLAAALILGQLMPHARQSFYAWVPMIVVLSVERSRDQPAKFRLAGLVVALSILGATVLAALLRTGSESRTMLFAYGLLARHPGALWRALVQHPVLDLSLSWAILPLAVVGAAGLHRVRWSFAAGLAGSFVMSLPQSWPSPGSIWAFRLPVYALVVIAAGVGAARVGERLGRSGWPAAAFAGVLVLGGLPLRPWRENRRTDPELQNYRFVRNGLVEARAGGVILPSDRNQPRSAAGALAPLLRLRTARDGDALDPRVRWIFADDLACHAFSVLEQLQPGAGEREIERWLEEDESRLVTALFGSETRYGLDGVSGPSERPACTALRARTTLITSGPTLTPRQDPPQIVYFGSAITPELRLLRSE